MNLAVDESSVLRVREVSSKFDTAYWREVCQKGTFPSEYWGALAKADLFGILLGKEWGGMEKGLVDLALATQETAERYAGLGSYLLHSGALSPMIFVKNADEQMKRRVVPSMARGKLRISIALTEEESGADALSMGTAARKESDNFVITGRKTFVTNADRADYLLLFARTKPVEAKDRAAGITAFLLDPRAKGVTVRKMEKVAMDFNTACTVDLKEARVDAADVVGNLGGAWRSMKDVFEMDRVLTAASLVGTGKLALNMASDHAKKRSVFGKAIGSYQGVQFTLADAMAQLIAAETLTVKAASMVEKGRGFTDWANLALLEALGAAGAATDRAMQTFGGHGYLKENDVERFWRDVRVHRFHPISEELLLSQIARKTLGLPGS